MEPTPRGLPSEPTGIDVRLVRRAASDRPAHPLPGRIGPQPLKLNDTKFHLSRRVISFSCSPQRRYRSAMYAADNPSYRVRSDSATKVGRGSIFITKSNSTHLIIHPTQSIMPYHRNATHRQILYIPSTFAFYRYSCNKKNNNTEMKLNRIGYT